MKFGWSLLSSTPLTPLRPPELHFTTRLYYCVCAGSAGMAGFSGFVVIICTGVHLTRI
jgi:hypothetical protein